MAGAAVVRTELLVQLLGLLPARAARRRVVVALSSVGSSVLLFVSPAAAAADIPRSGPPVGRLAPVSWPLGAARLTGWAIDPDARGPIRIRLTRDGRVVRTVTADLARPAVGRAYPFFGARHGYDATVPVPNGRHRLCAVARNVRAGHDTVLGCATVTGRNDPVGSFTAAGRVASGIRLTGWAVDPNTRAPLTVRVTLDGLMAASIAAALPTTLPPMWTGYGDRHGLTATLTTTPGAHSVCLIAVNTGLGHDRRLGCRTVPAKANAPGQPTQLTVSATTGTSITVRWAPPTIDGGAPVTGYQVGVNAAAAVPLPATTTTYTAAGLSPGTEYTVRVAATNAVGAGQAATVDASTPVVAPTAPRNVTTSVTSSAVTVSWTAPAGSGGAAVTGYRVTAAGVVQTLPATATGTTFAGLTASTSYPISVRAGNSAGYGAAATITATTAAAIPPQTTPAPVSTSHYLRNLSGSASHDTPLLRSMGATDAGYNPSGHRYLVLQDIGAQSGNGVLLSATTKWISYPALVSALDAYLDGYASMQKANAPMLLAIGTNNDGSVSQTTGAAWATNVVNLVGAYAARYPNITVAGADDIEPGFSATVTASRSWLTGYLGATSAQFVFNGSADGCPTSSGTLCNNGWTTTDLHWLSGGAAPTRILTLPQIYNTAMPKQWHLVSSQGAQKLAFAGPLTEWTACYQDNGSCYSTTNVTAWSLLFAALNADPRTAVTELPYGTDLRID